jgi:L-ascorbate metabolism protein UlaG (beta-lactamase superfamily)
VLSFVVPQGVQADEVEVLWLGHATTRITSVAGKVIVIDPFLRRNPKTPLQYKDPKALGKVDLILVTHGHGDHTRDLKELVELTGAPVVGPFELILNLAALGVIDGSKSIAMNKGGTVAPLGRGINVHMVPAEHSSGLMLRPFGLDTQKSPSIVAGGNAVGYVIEFENGFTIYHSGDTDVFGDMALIGKLFSPDLALVCIGGHFTMGPVRAAYALHELIKPKQVIPIHYGTFPVINRTPAELQNALGDSPIEMLDVSPGQVVKF